jgi:tetratricopeptide (TPR) repeat protein
MDLSEMVKKCGEAEELKKEAMNFLNTKDYKSALEKINEAIGLAPNYCALYNGRALIFIGMLEYKRALVDLNWVVKIMPNSPIFRLNRAICYIALKDFKKALADLNKMVKLAPKDPFCLLVRADFQLTLNHYDEAIVDCAAAIILDPSDQESIRKLLAINRQRARNIAALDLKLRRSRPMVFSCSNSDGEIASMIVFPEKETTN